MHTMDWEDLRYVLAVSREQSLSLAAARLGVSHTTVGRRIRTIEDGLGVRLFDRTPDAFVVTPAGQDIAEVAEKVEAEVLLLEGRVLGRDAQLRGRLRVATMDMLFRRFHSGFSSFKERYPLVDVTVLQSDEEVSLPRREADVAIRMTNTPPEYLVGRKVGRVSFCVFGEKGLVERMGKHATYSDFPWIHWDERIDMRPIDEWMQKNAPGARVALRIGGTGTGLIRETVATGIGVHFLATFDGDADPRLTRIGVPETQFDRGIWLLTLPDLRNTNRIRAFMQHMEERIRAIEAAADAPAAGRETPVRRTPKKPAPRRAAR
jgi:DNA-binding transcriptional LysR family regulator